ncbi:MAG TPA: hypothetical protein VFK47_20690 [Ktedonobacteraceae bacterium]|nr:hypothetical protein [Ktedonobacteraceae bacterium]
MSESTNTFSLGTLKFWALGDRILIQEDEFKSGYECNFCSGTGRTPCHACGGSGTSMVVSGARCSFCSGQGTETCPECNGKGGLIITPDIAQRRPTTGKIVSKGDKVETLKPGDSVLYSNFAGYVIDLERAGRKVTLRIIHESEVLCGMEGQLELRSLKGKSEIATFQN